MKTSELIDKISGIQTIESIKSILRVSRQKAVYFVHRLKSKGYVKTKYGSDKKRIYHISQENALGGVSYVDILNKHSPIKLATSEVYKIYGRAVSIEETIVYALKTRKIRYILASIALFRRVTNWKELHNLAKQNNLVREAGALYDLAQRILPKLRKMDKRFRVSALPKKKEHFRFIIENMSSKDYKDIEETWKIHIPFNKIDFEEYAQ